MAENILETLRQLVQDVVAPEVRELKERIAALEKLMDARFDAVLAAIGEARAHNELVVTKLVAGVSERVAVLEERGRK